MELFAHLNVPVPKLPLPTLDPCSFLRRPEPPPLLVRSHGLSPARSSWPNTSSQKGAVRPRYRMTEQLPVPLQVNVNFTRVDSASGRCLAGRASGVGRGD